jgi:hypothetical protein
MGRPRVHDERIRTSLRLAPQVMEEVRAVAKRMATSENDALTYLIRLGLKNHPGELVAPVTQQTKLVAPENPYPKTPHECSHNFQQVGKPCPSCGRPPR